MTAAAVKAPLKAEARRFKVRRTLRTLLPAFSLALVIAAIAYLNPRAISYFGFNLMLNLAIPIALATIAQMFVIAGNDLDLSIGTFVGFVGCIAATWLRDQPLLGALALFALLLELAPGVPLAVVCWTYGMVKTHPLEMFSCSR